MKYRAVASVALAAALAGGLAGCNLVSPQSTTIQYDASDGVGLSVGDLELRNILILVNPETEGPQTTGSLIGTVVNHAEIAGVIDVTIDGAAAQIPIDPQTGLTQVGYGDGEQILLEGAVLELGGDAEVTFTGPTGSTETIAVPVLDGTLDEYSTLVPTVPAETPAPAPTPPPATEVPVDGDEAPQP